MNEFLTNLSADNPLLWALFVLGAVVASALALSVVTGLLLRLGTALAAPLGRRQTAGKKTR
jgi:fumarate reductase subunit D